MTVVRPPEFAEDVETEAIIENARSHYDSELGKLRARASTAGVQPAICLNVGLLGSVSRVVIAYARCAVLVIR